jgi:hypothetical protein
VVTSDPGVVVSGSGGVGVVVSGAGGVGVVSGPTVVETGPQVTGGA